MWLVAVWALVVQADDACEDAEVCLLELGRGRARVKQPAAAAADVAVANVSAPALAPQAANAAVDAAVAQNAAAAAPNAAQTAAPNATAAAPAAPNATDAAPAAAPAAAAPAAAAPNATDAAAVAPDASKAAAIETPDAAAVAADAAAPNAAAPNAAAEADVLESTADVIARLKANKGSKTEVPVKGPAAQESAADVIQRLKDAQAKHRIASGQELSEHGPATTTQPPPAQPREDEIAQPEAASSLAASLRPREQHGFPKSNPKVETRNVVADRLAAAKMKHGAPDVDVAQPGGILDTMRELEVMIRHMPAEGDGLELQTRALGESLGERELGERMHHQQGSHATQQRTADEQRELFHPLDKFGEGKSLI